MRLVLKPLQRWIWRDPARRGQRLMRFAEIEADGGRDLVRAAELTRDPRMRRLYLRHAGDERRHAEIFRARALELLRAHRSTDEGAPSQWLAAGERGLDDVEVERDRDGPLLAFLHLSESAATRQFALYRDALEQDPATQRVFERILRDEVFHMNYTRHELQRIEPHHRRLLWRARLGRIWKAYLRFAVWLAGLIGGLVLTVQYYLFVSLFAWNARRGARREPEGWAEIPAGRSRNLRGQY